MRRSPVDPLEDMEIEPELKDFFSKQLSVKGDPEKEEKETSKDKSKEKENKWEEISTVTKADNKDSLLKKLLAFKAELVKDEGALQEAKLELKGQADKKEEGKLVAAALQSVKACQGKVENAIKRGCGKEEAKDALLASFAAFEKSKKCKKLVSGPAKKKAKVAAKEKSEEEEDDE